MCREDPKLRISVAEAYVRFLWLSASVNSADLDYKLTSTRKRGITQRVIRKWEKKPQVVTLLREIGLRDEASSSAKPSPPASVSWLPVHSV